MPRTGNGSRTRHGYRPPGYQYRDTCSIVSGEGLAFCSGLDTKELSQGNLTVDWFDTWERGVITLANLNAITIAAIHGYCLGGGLQIALGSICALPPPMPC